MEANSKSNNVRWLLVHYSKNIARLQHCPDQDQDQGHGGQGAVVTVRVV